jgi:inner membrane protein
MRVPLLGKLLALAAVMAVLLMALGAVDGVVGERQRRQLDAEQSVASSLAGPQTIVGPALQRRCQESWTRIEGEGKDRRKVTEQRPVIQTLWPRTLAVTTRATIEPRYRGLFKVNGYLAQSTLQADWADVSAPQANAERADARMSCEAPTLAVALSDARGVRAAQLRADGASLPLRPGSEMAANPRGLHAVLPAEASRSGPLHVELSLDVAGTASLAWAPVADESTVQARSDWAHPSFGGQFLPVSREVSAQGFLARWQISALATTAQQALRDGAVVCTLRDGSDAVPPPPGNAARACVDTFGVHFIDPVNSYVLSDRAIKYGLLFIGLTFVGVALVEVMRGLRVHPMQYLLVGCALTVFFLLLISLSEHVGFGLAYLCASAACTALLAFYGAHVLRGLRPGLAFGAAIAGLYGALYALLQLEQTALVLGSLLLFAVLAAVMAATRRLDWYAMAERAQAPSVAGGAGRAA